MKTRLVLPSLKPLQLLAPLGVCAACVLLAACAQPSSRPGSGRPAAGHVTRVAPGWAGSYKGSNVCPPPAAAGCTMDLMLTLNPGNTYSLTTTMLRRGKPYSFTSHGRFQWDAGTSVITLASKDENARLRVGQGQLERISTDALTPEEAARQPLVLRKLY